jgi:hypothetical protein
VEVSEKETKVVELFKRNDSPMVEEEGDESSEEEENSYE